MLAALGMATGVGGFVGGWLIDRGDPRRRLAAADALYALAGLAAGATATAGSPGWLLAAAALAGAGPGRRAAGPGRDRSDGHPPAAADASWAEC